MAVKPLLDVAILRQVLKYEPLTGQLIWLKRPRELFRTDGEFHRWNARYPDRPALTTVDGTGYTGGYLLSVRVTSHRVAFAIHTGAWPINELDHIDGDRANNVWVNLREVDHATNGKNQRRHSNNSSGVSGVCPIRNRWRVRIGANGKLHHVGVFDTFEEACAARKAAEEHHGFHPNHGRAA